MGSMADRRTNRSAGLRILFLAGLVCLSIGPTGWADLLIVEPFDYPAAEELGDDSLAGADGGVGWLSEWDTFIEGETDGYIEVMPGSLPFSNYPTFGNHVGMGLLSTTQPPDNGTTFARPTRNVDVTLESGDLWASYLYQRLDDENGNGSRWAEIRDNEGFQFALDPKAPDSHGIRTRYDNTFGDIAEDASVQDQNVYLMIAKFANLGTTDGSGSGSMWALSEANYDAIKADGITETELDANHVLKAVDEDPGETARTLQLGDRFRFVIGTDVALAENFPFAIAFDELRYGTTLADVAPGVSDPCDFDSDGLCNTVDIDLLGKEIIAGTNDPSFDVNGDGEVTLADQDQWRADAAAKNGFVESYLNGDANLDGSVLVGDLNAVGTNWQTSPDPWSSGDFNADGVVDVADLNLLALNWQQSIPAAAAGEAVPEPSAIMLLILAATAGCLARRHLFQEI
jgi:hypothetical protein